MMEVPKGTTVNDVVKIITEQYGEKARDAIIDDTTHHFKVAFCINKQITTNTAVLEDGDTLSLIPPISGGK
jgi:molybdopterin converting factor small subunit